MSYIQTSYLINCDLLNLYSLKNLSKNVGLKSLKIKFPLNQIEDVLLIDSKSFLHKEEKKKIMSQLVVLLNILFGVKPKLFKKSNRNFDALKKRPSNSFFFEDDMLAICFDDDYSIHIALNFLFIENNFSKQSCFRKNKKENPILNLGSRLICKVPLFFFKEAVEFCGKYSPTISLKDVYVVLDVNEKKINDKFLRNSAASYFQLWRLSDFNIYHDQFCGKILNKK